jgi:hypothetical protein
VLKAQIADVTRQIQKNKGPSTEVVGQFKKFQAEEARINEVITFLNAKPPVSTLILRLARTLPPNIAIDSMDLRETGLVLRLSVRGDATAASGYATAYYEQLRADKELTARFEDVIFTGTPMRNATTGRMTVEILLRAKPAPKS